MWDYQTAVHKKLVDQKLQSRSGHSSAEIFHHLLFCEHYPVFTIGKSGLQSNLLMQEDFLESIGFDFFKINRGGDITYHGPGQIVGYPIFDLEYFFTDVHRYVRSLEEAVMRTLSGYGVKAGRDPGYTGVWIDADKPAKRKICAIGVHLSRWVTMHGFAFNINTQLRHFDYIVPCGINDPSRSVTSLQKEIGGAAVPMQEVKDILKQHLAEIFGFEFAVTHEERHTLL